MTRKEPRDRAELLALCQEMESEHRRLTEEVRTKKLLLISRPLINFSQVFRKAFHVAEYCLKYLKLWPKAGRFDFPDRNSDLVSRIRVLKREFKYLSYLSLRLEAEIVYRPVISLTGLYLFFRYLPDAFISLFYAHLVRGYRHKLGVLHQNRPRVICTKGMPPRLQRSELLPRIQVVIPSYQQGQYLERTLRSVLDQKYPALKLRVHDGGSTDNTKEIILRYESQLAGWVSEKDNGQTDAISRGFSHRDGEIMAYVNSDDLLLPGTLALVGAYFATHPRVDIVYGHRIIIDSEDMEVGRWFLPQHDNDVLRWADYLPQETMFWRRELYEKVGGMDVSFRFAMDWDLILRFQEAGARFIRLPYFLGAFRVHAAQKTSDIMSSVGYMEMQRIRERIHQRVVDDVEIAHHTSKYLLISSLLSRWYYLKNWCFSPDFR